MNKMNMGGIEILRQLPMVLDDVHRRTLASHFREAGLEVQAESWAELEEMAPAYIYDDYDENRRPDMYSITYAGTQSFGPLFGDAMRLIESGPARWAYGMYGGLSDLGDWVMKREIHVCPPGDLSPRPARILCIPDVPPVGLHGEVCAEIERRYGFEEIGNDSRLLEKVQAFRPEAVEFIGEDVARGIIRALTQDVASVTQV